MKFNISNYPGKYVMHCKTEAEAISFCKYLDNAGRRWASGAKYTDDTYYQGEMLFFFNEGTWDTSSNMYEDEYSVLEWSNFEESVPNQKKYRILIDMDDTIEDLTPKWLQLLDVIHRNDKDWKSITVDDITEWNIMNAFPNYSVDEIFEPLNMVDTIWNIIRPIPGAAEALKKWNEDNRIEVRLLTSSHYTSLKPKREFLREYFPFLKWNQVIVASEKQFVKGNVLIDDYEENLIGGEYEGVLFVQPRNKNFNAAPYNIVKCNNWAEIEKAVDKKIADHFSL